MKLLDRLALLLVVIGGIHLLLIGLLNLNVFETVFGSANESVTDIVYIVIGLAAL